MKTQYTMAELAAYVRRERAQLTAELGPLKRRIAEISDRLHELDKADNLLEGV